MTVKRKDPETFSVSGWDSKVFEDGIRYGNPWSTMYKLTVFKENYRYNLLRTVDMSLFFFLALLIKSTEDALHQTWMIQTYITNMYIEMWKFFDTRLQLFQLEDFAVFCRTLVLEVLQTDPEKHTMEFLEDRILAISRYMADRSHHFLTPIPDYMKLPRHHIGRETFALVWCLIHQPTVIHRPFHPVKSNESEPIDLSHDISSCQEDQDTTNSKKNPSDSNSCLTPEATKTNED